MRVGIVGAGICGLSAARSLLRSGHQVVVFEKNGTVGGRVASRREGDFLWDTGATSIAPRGKRIEAVLLNELDRQGLVKVEKPIYVHEGLRVHPGHAQGAARYTYSTGIVTFAERLAEGAEVRLGHQVEAIEKEGGRYRIGGDVFDGLILTPPIPQSSMLLWNLGESRAMANVRYRPCLSILLGYHASLPPMNYHALLDPDQVHPLTWLSLESIKSPGRAPEGSTALCAQMSPAFSLARYERDDAELVQTVNGYIQRLYGPGFQSPACSSVVRWKYSQPVSLATFEHVNQKGSRLLIASDGLLGGHIEDAFEVGTRTAEQLVEED